MLTYWGTGDGAVGLTVHQQVPRYLRLLGIQFDDRSLEHAVAVDAAWVDSQRSVHSLDRAALVDVAVHREQRLVLVDRGANSGRPDRPHHAAAVPRAQRPLQSRGLAQPGSVRAAGAIEDSPGPA